MRAIPSIAWVPLFILWLGIGIWSKVLVVIVLVLFPVAINTEAGLRKRTQWEDTWALQRREDAGEDVGNIPVPPKYKSTDFLKASVWQLRGGLDVPKERWISYPGCERGADGSLPIAWAGWDHLQQATALAAYYLEMKENEGWEAARLQPVLAGLLELVPWLEQWHNEVDPVYGERHRDCDEHHPQHLACHRQRQNPRRPRLDRGQRRGVAGGARA